MRRDIRRMVNVLENIKSHLDELEEEDYDGIIDNIIWVVQKCTIPRIRYHSALNTAFEVLIDICRIYKLEGERDMLCRTIGRIFESLIVISVFPINGSEFYKFVPENINIDAESILKTTENIFMEMAKYYALRLTEVQKKIGLGLTYSLVITVLSAINNNMRNIPSRLTKNINRMFKFFYKHNHRVKTFKELIELIIFPKINNLNKKLETMKQISIITKIINDASEKLLNSIPSEYYKDIKTYDLKINEVIVYMDENKIHVSSALYELLGYVYGIGRNMAKIIRKFLSSKEIEEKDSLNPLLEGLIRYLEEPSNVLIMNSLEHDIKTIEDLTSQSKFTSFISAALTFMLVRQWIIKTLFQLCPQTYDYMEIGITRDNILQIICIGYDYILKNIMTLPVVLCDGNAYVTFSRGPGRIAINLRATKILILKTGRDNYYDRYLDPQMLDREIENELTIYDLYRGNIAIPWFEIRLKLVNSPNSRIFLVQKDKNIYKGHIEFKESYKWAPYWNPGRLTLIAYMLLTSPRYEKMVNEGLSIRKLGLEVKYLGPPDIYDFKIRPTICNYVLDLLRKSIHTKTRKIVILSTLAEEIRFKFLLVKDGAKHVIHVDILPIIPKDLDLRKPINTLNIVDTLRLYMDVYRLEHIGDLSIEQ